MKLQHDDAHPDTLRITEGKFPRTLYPLHRSTNAGVEFGLESVPAGSGIPRHRHAHQSEILFVQRGCMQVFISKQVGTELENREESKENIGGSDEEMILVRANQAVLIPRGHWHRALNVTGTAMDPGFETGQRHKNGTDDEDGTLWITWTLMREAVATAGDATASPLTEQIIAP